MTRQVYSSLAAFIAHWQALARTPSKLGPHENELLAAIEKLTDTLTPAERETLNVSSNQSGTEVRRRERIELKLRRMLLAAGWLQD